MFEPWVVTTVMTNPDKPLLWTNLTPPQLSTTTPADSAPKVTNHSSMIDAKRGNAQIVVAVEQLFQPRRVCAT